MKPPNPPLKRLDRYVLAQFFQLFVIMVAAVILLFIIVNFFERLDKFVDRRAPPGAILRFYAFQIPYLYVLFSPVGALLAAFFSVGEMARRYEILAVKTAGVSVYRFLAPLIGAGFLLSAVAFGVNDLLVPDAQHRVREIKTYEMHLESPRTVRRLRDMAFLGPGGVLYYFGKVANDTLALQASITRLDSLDRVVFRVDADTAVFRQGFWHLRHGTEFRFVDGRPVQVTVFQARAYPEFTETPAEFLKQRRRLDELSIRGLRRLIHTLEQAGFDTNRERVELQVRFAFPLANLIVLLFALALSVEMRGRGRAYGFGLAVFVAFFYWGLLQATRSMAGVGQLNPVFSAWFPNLVFLTAALWAFRRVRT